MYDLLLVLLGVIVEASAAGCSDEMIRSEMRKLGYNRGFTNVTIGRGDNRDKINVFLECEGEWHKFECKRRQLIAEDQTKSRCGNFFSITFLLKTNAWDQETRFGITEKTLQQEGCEPMSKTTNYDIFNYTAAPLANGVYENGTEVTLSCTSGPLYHEPATSTCIDGHWLPKLEQCPDPCSVAILTTERKYPGIKLIPEVPPEQTWQKHLGKARAYCLREPNPEDDLEHQYPETFSCVYGKWYPTESRCPSYRPKK